MTTFATEFGAHFQLHFVAHMLRDQDFLARVCGDISEASFADEYLARIVRAILTFQGTHGGPPGSCLYQEIQDMRQKGMVEEEVASRVTLYLDKLLSLPLDNRQYLLARFQEFSRYSKIEANLQGFIEAAKGRDFKTANDLMNSMMRTPGVTDLGTQYTPDTTERVLRRYEEDSKRLWTLIPEIDQYIDGLRAGELGVMQSRLSSDGKTAAMVLLSRNFLFQGKKVLILVLEGSVAGMEDRLDMCIGAVHRNELIEEDTEASNRLHNGLNRMFAGGGQIWIKKFSAYKTTVSEMRDYAKQLEASTGFVPDVLVCDYLDLCSPETPSLRGDLYAAGRETYMRFLEWLEELGVPGWTVMQSGRGAADEKQADQKHTGGSITKVQLATVVISINRSDEDRKMSRISLFVVKNRDGQSRYEIPIPCDFATMRFWVPNVYTAQQSDQGVPDTQVAT